MKYTRWLYFKCTRYLRVCYKGEHARGNLQKGNNRRYRCCYYYHGFWIRIFDLFSLLREEKHHFRAAEMADKISLTLSSRENDSFLYTRLFVLVIEAKFLRNFNTFRNISERREKKNYQLYATK